MVHSHILSVLIESDEQLDLDKVQEALTIALQEDCVLDTSECQVTHVISFTELPNT